LSFEQTTRPLFPSNAVFVDPENGVGICNHLRRRCPGVHRIISFSVLVQKLAIEQAEPLTMAQTAKPVREIKKQMTRA
jgi:hypothetical protein